MFKSWMLATLGVCTVVSVLFNSCNCLSPVKMVVTVHTNSMTLSCFITNRDSRKNIYLFCPLVSNELNCRENCERQCQEESCPADSLILCQDLGFNADSGVYQIDYIIDGSKPQNHGKWFCQYGGMSSSIIYVNATSSNTVAVTKKTTPSVVEKNTIPVEAITKSGLVSLTVNNEEMGGNIQIDKLLLKSEFIITVIGLLVLSLVFNCFFCCRLIIIRYQSKKNANEGSQSLSMSPNNPPFNHSNSQVSDLERIYEDTPFNYRQYPMTAQIKPGNGTYLPPRTLSPTSTLPSTLPNVPYTQSTSFPNSSLDSGSSHQLQYPFVPNHQQSKFTPVNFPNESNYTNFVSVQPELCVIDGNNISQPVYLAFTAPHQVMTTANRYLQYGNPALQSIATMSRDNRHGSRRSEMSSSTMPRTSNQKYKTSSDDNKSNYQLSREMMEEADNLLRTADTLLKSTDDDMRLYEQ